MQMQRPVSAVCLISMLAQFYETPLFTILHLMEEVKWLGGITQLAKGRSET